MHSSTLLTTLLLTLTACLTSAQYLNQTAPFHLQILSSNTTLNGTYLFACHEGAAIEGLCTGPSAGFPQNASPFTFNYSSAQTPDATVGPTGLLTYLLHGGNFNVSSPMALSYNPTSNVAVPLLMPAETGTLVAFIGDKLVVPGFVDDSVSPPAYGETKAYERWQVCLTNAGYQYNTLAWLMGSGEPQNPSCQKVDVRSVPV
jgi:hypothetical protein